MVREYRTALMQLVRRKQELLQWMHRFDRRIGVLEEEIEEVADVLYQLKAHGRPGGRLRHGPGLPSGGGGRRIWGVLAVPPAVPGGQGGKASKKSSTAAIWFILHLMKMPGANLLVVRQVYRTHLDSTYAQLRWAIRRLRVEHLWQACKSPLELIYRPTGQRILFRGFDDVNQARVHDGGAGVAVLGVGGGSV